MATKVWETEKTCTCAYLGREVEMEAQVVYPADHLPDAPRVVGHRCSMAAACDISDEPNCAYAYGAIPVETSHVVRY